MISPELWWGVVGAISGLFTGMGLWAFVISRDGSIVHLLPDEQIIKRPMPQFVLVQVTPEVARRLVNFGGDIDSPNRSTEARSLYPERVLKIPESFDFEESKDDQK